MKLAAHQIFLVLSLLLIAQHGLASPHEKLDAIKIIIDKDVVTVSQFNQRIDQTKMSMQAQGQAFDEAALAEDVQDQLIVESLQLQIAERSGIQISNQQLDEALNDTARRNQLSLAQLKVQIESEGQDYHEFRENMRRQMLIQHVQQGHIRSKVNITDKEVDNYLATPAGKNITEDSYDVSYITYPLAGDASEQDVAKGEQALKTLR
ncbi:MAG: SurA N-terminal domain-containing protein, partial [Sinobacterium sp.]|nr:SurA N-terminal domain-containing protein [Sinobacterium sp.]